MFEGVSLSVCVSKPVSGIEERESEIKREREREREREKGEERNR